MKFKNEQEKKLYVLRFAEMIELLTYVKKIYPPEVADAKWQEFKEWIEKQVKQELEQQKLKEELPKINQLGQKIFYSLDELKEYVLKQYKNHPKYIDVTNYDVSHLTSLEGVFANLSLIEQIKGIENWHTHEVKNLNKIFYGCSNLKVLDLSNWDVSNVVTREDAFTGCNFLFYISPGSKSIVVNGKTYLPATPPQWRGFVEKK